jgi:hypothetical protein
LTTQWEAGRLAHGQRRKELHLDSDDDWHSGSDGKRAIESTMWPYEEFLTDDGSIERRLRSSLFCVTGLTTLIAGISLHFSNETVAILLLTTVAPCLPLYPVARLLVSGKDSVLPAIGTVIFVKFSIGVESVRALLDAMGH